MEKGKYLDIVDHFQDMRILVVGDIYLDENIYGTMTGISIEAPIPIFEKLETRHNPGAAGNMACNAAALGAETHMLGVIGSDVNAGIVLREFEARDVRTGHVVADPSRPTNTYGKLRAHTPAAPPQEVLRTDTPAPTPISGEVEAAVIRAIEDLATQVDVIAVVDQVSSVVTGNVLQAIAGVAREYGLITVGDSRERAGMFHDFDAIVPNEIEAARAIGADTANPPAIDEIGNELLKICKNALVTRSEKGIACYSRDSSPQYIPGPDAGVVDVTGAGDTVTATVACALASGASPVEAAWLGNTAAGIAVEQPGVVTVSQAQLRHAIEYFGSPSKLKTRDELREIVRVLNAHGKKVVWTNGCFDLMHAGHITYLQKAARLGDVLVLGLNSDASVRRLKGPSRPIFNEHERALVLSELQCIDYITFFDEPNVVPLLTALRPDVYAKGGDYTAGSINQEERRLVEDYGGAIEIIPGVEGQSTSALINRILENGNR